MYRVSSRLLLAGLTVFAAPLPSFADDTPEITVTAGRRAQPVDQVGSAVTIITPREIEQSRGASAADVLRSVPGITVVESGGVGGTTEVKLRGAEARHTLVLIDGIRVNDPASARASFDFAAFSVTDIERIEVLRGPQSALYGGDAIGGVINIITRKGRGDARGTISVEGGSYHTGRISGAISGGGPKVSASASGTIFFSEGFSRYVDGTEDDGTVKFAGTARLLYSPVPWAELEVGGSAYRQNSDLDEIDSTPRDADDTSERLVTTGYARAKTQHWGSRFISTVTGFVTRSERNFKDDTRGRSTYEGTRIGGEWQGEVNLDRYGTLIVGAYAEHEEADISEAGFFGPTLISESQSTTSVFALHSIDLTPRLTVSLGGRLDNFDDGGTFATFRTTAAFAIPETGTILRASAGSGAKAPTLYQRFHPTFGDPTLEVEESLGFDVGIDQSLFDDRLSIGVTVFHNSFDNLIEYDFGTNSYQNAGSAETFGIEATATATLVPGVLMVSGDYTYLHTENTDTGDALARRPEHEGAVSVVFTGVPRLRVEGKARFVGERFNRSRERDLLQDYVRVDLFASYRLNNTLTLTGRIENLFDADYEDPRNFATPGLSAYAGVTANF